MRRLVWFAVALVALAAAGVAIARGIAWKTDAVMADFSTQAEVRDRTCMGTDGHVYRHARVRLEGEINSSDSRLDGKLFMRLTVREDVTAGHGTVRGRMWIGDGDERKVSARVIAVKTNGKLNGFIHGRVDRAVRLYANFTGEMASDGDTNGELGKDSMGPSNTAVIQSRHDVRCDRPGEDEDSDEDKSSIEDSKVAKLEVTKQLSPADDSGRFDLLIDRKVEASSVGNGGTTGEETVRVGRHRVKELGAGTTRLRDYSTRITCRDGNGAGSVIASGGGDGDLTVNVAENADVVCVIENTRRSGDQATTDSNKDGDKDDD